MLFFLQAITFLLLARPLNMKVFLRWAAGNVCIHRSSASSCELKTTTTHFSQDNQDLVLVYHIGAYANWFHRAFIKPANVSDVFQRALEEAIFFSLWLFSFAFAIAPLLSMPCLSLCWEQSSFYRIGHSSRCNFLPTKGLTGAMEQIPQAEKTQVKPHRKDVIKMNYS